MSGNSSSAGQNDGPKATLAAAIEAARADGVPTTILIEGGDYFQEQAVHLGAQDKGLTIAAAPGQSPVLHGGRDLSSAHWVNEGNGVFSTTLAPSSLPGGVQDLHIDGARQTLARYPNETPGDASKGWLFAAKGTSGYEQLHFKAGDIPQLGDVSDLRVMVFDDKQWTSNTVKVQSIDYNARTISFADNVAWHQVGEGSRYFLFNAKEALDQPGEWFYDDATGKLYLKSVDASALAGGHSIVAATTDSLIEIADTSGVTVEGLTLRDASPHGSDRGAPYFQTGGGAIKVTDSSGITLEGNKIANVGVGINALDLTDSTITGNSIEHATGNGIHLGMQWEGQGSARVEITDNTVRDVGTTYVEAAGIWFTGTSDSHIAGNTVEDAAQFGIYGGQIRQSGEDAIRDNVIERNIVRHVNTLTSDGGGIKLFGALHDGASGNVIRYNWVDGVTHLMNRPDGSFYTPDEWSGLVWPQPIAAGLYLDWNQKDTVILGNIVTNSYGGVLIVNSDGTLIKDNVIQGGYGAAIELIEQPDAGRAPISDNLITGNVLMRDEAHAAMVKIYDANGGVIGRFEGNLYSGLVNGDAFFIQGSTDYGNWKGGITSWVNGGWAARNETQGNPGFADPTHGDFTLTPSSPLPGLGLTPDADLTRLIHDTLAGISQGDPAPGDEVGQDTPPDTTPPPSEPPQTDPSHPEPALTKVTLEVSGDAFRDAKGGLYPEFELMVDGQAYGPKVAVTASHKAGSYQHVSFEIDQAPSTIGKIGILYHNDLWDTVTGSLPGKDRALYVKSVVVADTVLQPEDGTWLPHWGESLAGRGELWTRGTLEFDLKHSGVDSSTGSPSSPPPPPAPPPAPGPPETLPEPAQQTLLTVVASGDPYKDAWTGPWPEMQVLVNGAPLGKPIEITALHGKGEHQSVTFQLDQPLSQIDKVALAYTNDSGVWTPETGWVAGQDRNLYIDSVQVGDLVLEPKSGTWLPHWGAVLPGTGDLTARGTLEFDIEAIVTRNEHA